MAKLKIETVHDFSSRDEWEGWLAEHHASVREAWLRFAKKGTDAVRVSRADALEVALCYGWIDGQAASQDDVYWLQRFTPRTRRSKWSRINRDAAEQLIARGMMEPAGLAAVKAAKADGRWDAAYASPASIDVPEDLRAALGRSPAADAFFKKLDAQNRYAILYRIDDAKKPETRARRIEKFVGMLERGERIHG
jgi:uncharacterized protein YdeI (YjbR/CyaY-like superfamily)